MAMPGTFDRRDLRELVHAPLRLPRAVTQSSRTVPRLAGMKAFLLDTLRLVRTDRDLQDALFCSACWLGFASVVIGSVALPA
jgi:hypothetical protein